MKNIVTDSTEQNFIEWANKELCGANLNEGDDVRHGVPMGIPSVKELIAILSKLPEDYRVSCCGGENYLYIWPEQKSITIDNEWYLG